MENEYNKRFKNKEMSNDDFDVDGLWDDITGELDTIPVNTPTFPWEKLGGGLLLLLIISGIGFVVLNSNNTFLSEDNAPLVESKNIERTGQKSEVDSDLAINSIKEKENPLSPSGKANLVATNTQDPIIKDEVAISRNKNQTSNSNSKNNYSNKETDDKNIKNTHSSKSDTDKSEIKNDQNQTVSTKKSSFESNIEFTNSTRNKPADNEIRKNIEKPFPKNTAKKGTTNNTAIVDSLSYAPINELIAFTPTIPDSLLYVGIREIPKKKVNENKDSKRKLAFEGGVYGGMNSTFVKFSSTSDATYADTRNTSERSVFGSTYGVQMGLLYKGWRANTGLEFHDMWTRLDTKTIVNSSATVVVPQALTLVVIDSTGSTVNREFQDTTVGSTTTHTVAHYNNFQMWRIPLEIGRYRSGKKWAYGFSAGTSFNFLINQSGRILDADNQLLEFDKDAENVLFQSFSMSVRANLMLGYKLSKNVMVTVRPQWNWTANTLLNNTLKADIHQANVSLGIRAVF